MWLRKWHLQEQANDGTGGSGGGAAGADLTKLQAQLEAMVKGMVTLAEGLDKMDARINEMTTSKKDADPPTGGSGDQSKDLDLNGLPNDQLVAIMTQRTLKALEEGPMAKLQERLDGLSKDLSQVGGRLTYRDLKERDGDLDKWAEEVQAELKRNTGLAPEDALMLAKARNPEKVKKLEDERKQAAAANDKDRPVFGGLTPTSRRGSEDAGKMKPSEAAESAWQSVMSQFGDVFGPDHVNIV